MKARSEDHLTLGQYVDFPFRGHYEVGYQYAARRAEMTSCVLNALREVKQRNEDAVLSVAGIEGEIHGSRTTDVKVADGERFLLFGPSLLSVLEATKIAAQPTTFDFAISFRYSHLKTGRRVYLYSDRFLVRFEIIDGKFQLSIFHRKGIGRTSPEEVAALIESRLIETMRRRNLEPRIEILQEQI